MSPYTSEAEAYRYMMAFNRAIFQACARLSLSAEKASQNDGGGSEDFGTTELPKNECAAPKLQGRVKLIPITLDVLKDKLKNSAFEFDKLEKAVTHRCELVF